MAIIAGFAVICMFMPVLTIDERRYSAGSPSSTPVVEAVRSTFKLPDFRRLVFADFSYFTGLTIAQTGLLFYVTVLLEREEELVATLLAVLVLVSFLFYPLVNYLAKRVGKKPLIIVSFIWMAAVFLGVLWLGRLSFDATAQAYVLILLLSVPIAFLGVLPFATLSDIADYDSRRSGESPRGDVRGGKDVHAEGWPDGRRADVCHPHDAGSGRRRRPRHPALRRGRLLVVRCRGIPLPPVPRRRHRGHDHGVT